MCIFYPSKKHKAAYIFPFKDLTLLRLARAISLPHIPEFF